MHQLLYEQAFSAGLPDFTECKPAKLLRIDQLLRGFTEKRLLIAGLLMIIDASDELGAPGIDGLEQRHLIGVHPAPDHIPVHSPQVGVGGFFRRMADPRIFFLKNRPDRTEHRAVSLFEPDGAVVQKMPVRLIETKLRSGGSDLVVVNRIESVGGNTFREPRHPVAPSLRAGAHHGKDLILPIILIVERTVRILHRILQAVGTVHIIRIPRTIIDLPEAGIDIRHGVNIRLADLLIHPDDKILRVKMRPAFALRIVPVIPVNSERQLKISAQISGFLLHLLRTAGTPGKSKNP